MDFDNGTTSNHSDGITNSSNRTDNIYDPIALSHTGHGNAFPATTTELFADNAQSRTIKIDIM